MKKATSSFLNRWEETWQRIQAYAATHGSLNIRRLAGEMGISHQALGQRIERARARGLVTDAQLDALRPTGPDEPTLAIQLSSVPLSLVERLDALATERGLSRSALILQILQDNVP